MSIELPALRRAAREIFIDALDGVDAGRAVRSAVSLEASSLKICDLTLDDETLRAGVYSIAIGKAARPMASALDEILGESLKAGVITAPTITDSLPSRWRAFSGGHPLPNLESLGAARAAFALLSRAESERANLIFLISGGGSAMMEWPRDEMTTLEDLQEANRALVSCGASITEINAVRRAFSAMKGGGLSLHAPHCKQVSLIVSDTTKMEAATVASGPTFVPETFAPDPVAVVARYRLETKLPDSILRAIRRSADKDVLDTQDIMCEHRVLLDNDTALEAATRAARARGFVVEVARDVTDQPVDEGCLLLLKKLFDLQRRARSQGRIACLISGGEFACPVRGRGVGGRNSESALRWAIELETLAGELDEASHIAALSAGTDGVDGNSVAAGAIIDETTTARARDINLDAGRYLQESDAYTFFQALGDLIVTGPTGTNVRDLRILLAG